MSVIFYFFFYSGRISDVCAVNIIELCRFQCRANEISVYIFFFSVHNVLTLGLAQLASWTFTGADTA